MVIIHETFPAYLYCKNLRYYVVTTHFLLFINSKFMFGEKTLQDLSYCINILYFLFSFDVSIFPHFPLMKALVYVDIAQNRKSGS